jgi:hypothetical protein
MMINRLIFVLAACLLAACPATVTTTSGGGGGGYRPPPDRPPPDRPTRPAWDSTGWTLLGSQWVDGRVDRDVIKVSRWDNKLTKLTMVVTDSDLDLIDFVVVFGTGERWEPRIKHTFREGERARVIDLPGNVRQVSQIELRYANRAGGGRARVEIYGKEGRVADAPPPPPPPPPPPTPAWDSAGWTLLGSQWVDGNVDKDTFKIARWDNKLTKLTMVVTESDLDLIDFVVVFGNRERWSPKLKHTFREGSRARAIDLPGNVREVKQIELVYANRRGGGRAKVELYGKEGAAPPPPPPAWDSTGWTLLGSQSVEGKRDKDTFAVGKQQGKFQKLMLVVKDSDLVMLDFVVTFENNTKFEPKLKYEFRENERTRAIDLPGATRKIKKIDVRYENLPGGGKARVEIYGK